jgi:Virulence factor
VPEVTVISWRDIPAQVTGGTGRGAARAQLSERFQEAIDAAAMSAGLFGTDGYLGEWGRATVVVDGDDLGSAVRAHAAHLEETYSDGDLARLARAGGKE